MSAFAELSAPFAPDKISWRVGSINGEKTKGMALAYIDARDVMERLDASAGPGNWQDRYEFHEKKTICYLSIRVGDEWVTKADGAGDSDVEAEKGALSDAFKRAAVKWGIGRYLYDVDSPWVEIESRGRSFAIKPSEHTKLRNLLSRSSPAAPTTTSRLPPEPENTPKIDAVESKELASEMIAELKALKDAAVLQRWFDARTSAGSFDNLSEADKARVRETYRQTRNNLNPPADLRKAG